MSVTNFEYTKKPTPKQKKTQAISELGVGKCMSGGKNRIFHFEII